MTSSVETALPSLRSTLLSLLSLTVFDVTLFAGRVVAASAVPPASTMNTDSVAITFA